MTEFEQSLTSKDTADVEKVVAQFYGNIKDKNYYDAAAMLYTRKVKNAEIRQLSNEEMDKFVNVQRQLPFEGYTLDYVKFLTETENEVSCTVILRKGEQGMPDATTKMFFTPVVESGVSSSQILNAWRHQSLLLSKETHLIGAMTLIKK